MIHFNTRLILFTLLVTAIITVPYIAFSHSKKHANNSRVTPEAVLHYVNEFREKKGLNPLKMNETISSEAEKHSIDMARKLVPFGHAGFDHRAKRLLKELSSRGIAENVAYGDASAKYVVDMWKHSPGHRKNMFGKYNLTGIGIASDRHGTLYFTQIFINK